MSPLIPTPPAERSHLHKPEVVRVHHLLVEAVISQGNHISAAVEILAAAAATATARAAAARAATAAAGSTAAADTATAATAAAGAAAAAAAGLHTEAAECHGLCLLHGPLHQLLGGAAAVVINRLDLAGCVGVEELDGWEAPDAKLWVGRTRSGG